MSGHYTVYVCAAYGLSAVTLAAAAALAWLKYRKAKRDG